MLAVYWYTAVLGMSSAIALIIEDFIQTHGLMQQRNLLENGVNANRRRGCSPFLSTIDIPYEQICKSISSPVHTSIRAFHS